MAERRSEVKLRERWGDLSSKFLVSEKYRLNPSTMADDDDDDDGGGNDGNDDDDDGGKSQVTSTQVEFKALALTNVGEDLRTEEEAEENKTNKT